MKLFAALALTWMAIASIDLARCRAHQSVGGGCLTSTAVDTGSRIKGLARNIALGLRSECVGSRGATCREGLDVVLWNGIVAHLPTDLMLFICYTHPSKVKSHVERIVTYAVSLSGNLVSWHLGAELSSLVGVGLDGIGVLRGRHADDRRRLRF